uniref:Uncharacterized protein n=1 Tax=Gasterosteus aculeatus TaxID=69293 RepID=G3PG60_GASAC
RLTITAYGRGRKPDSFAVFCPFVLSFYCFFAISSQVTKASSEQKRFATLPPSNPVESLEKRNTPHCKPPSTFRSPTPLHSHASQNKVLHSFCIWGGGVSAQALLKLLQTRDWHHTGKISEVSVLLRGKRGGVKKQTSLFFVLEL